MTRRQDGHLFVVPKDAAPLVASGKLDERLFDVTLLRDFGYGDAQRDSVPLIVAYAPGARRTLGATLDLPVLNAAAVPAAKNGSVWQELTGPNTTKVWLDGQRKSTLDRSVPQINAPQAWQAGWTGKDVKVAVLDTGVDQTHPDLAGREIAEQNFSRSPDSVDRVGHGTHVASTIAGTGSKYKGVAHGAQILDGKVLDDRGSGSDSQILAGMQWAVAQGAKVVNLSLGAGDTPGIDPLEEAVNTLSATHGTLFVIAAGNEGPHTGTLGSPGTADAALTVGAVDRAGQVAGFSSRGPSLDDTAIKPDVTAPGTDIVAAKATGGAPGEGGHVAMSGTSMATPHVAGAAAVVAQAHPDWTGRQIKAALSASTAWNDQYTAFEQGSGRVDVARAAAQRITSDPMSVNFGTQRWPHGDDQKVGKEVTYTNSGSTEVTLDVALRMRGPDGTPVPAGLLTVSPAEVTVPAGGSAKVTITADTRLGSSDGVYSGTVSATAGDVSVNTAFAVNREPESYDLTIKHTGHDGALAEGYSTGIYSLADGRRKTVHGTDGSPKIRVRKGQHLLDSYLITQARVDWLTHPALDVTGDTTVELDFRKTKQTKITPPDPAAKMHLTDIASTRTAGNVSFTYGWLAFEGDDVGTVWTGRLGPGLPPGEFSTQVNSHWSAADGTFYGMAWFEKDFPTGFTRAPKKSELAHVRSSFGATAPEHRGYRSFTPFPKSGRGPGSFSVSRPVTLPGTRDEYLTTESTSWGSTTEHLKADGTAADLVLIGPVRDYPAGRITTESVNRGVFGPVLPATRSGTEWVTRSGDTMNVLLPLFGDSGGNAGLSFVGTRTTTLDRDGVRVGNSDDLVYSQFTVPAGDGRFTLTSEATRPGDLSTTVRGVWTFRSTTTKSPVRLPIATIQFQPSLDAANSAPAGHLYPVPIAVRPQAGNNSIIPASLTVDASYDGGKTWHEAKVVAGALAILHHPPRATSVSLRAKATDRAGNTFEQTIVNAYKLR